MARLLIVGGGERCVSLSQALKERGHVTRIVASGEGEREALKRAGAECWIGDPLRLATMTGALEGVTIVCWLLGDANGSEEEVEALHDARLRAFLERVIDSTVRGVVYEASGSAPESVLSRGTDVAREMTERNAIPLRLLTESPTQRERWMEEARAAVASLLGEG